MYINNLSLLLTLTPYYSYLYTKTGNEMVSTKEEKNIFGLDVIMFLFIIFLSLPHLCRALFVWHHVACRSIPWTLWHIAFPFIRLIRVTILFRDSPLVYILAVALLKKNLDKTLYRLQEGDLNPQPACHENSPHINYENDPSPSPSHVYHQPIHRQVSPLLHLKLHVAGGCR